MLVVALLAAGCGSGGFNAGMTQVISGAGLTGEMGQPDFVWWLDSDARAARKCLREMVKVLARHPRIGGVGSALGDPPTGLIWETGASIVRSTGYIKPGLITDKRFYVKADYLAACSGLVRREAIERTGLFPPNFIYYDDIDWCVQMTAKTTRLFLGMQVQCTQCHDHPFNEWKQDQFWKFNSFFRQTAKVDHRKYDAKAGRMIDDYSELVWRDYDGPVYFERRNGEMKVAYPIYFGAEVDAGPVTERVSPSSFRLFGSP